MHGLAVVLALLVASLAPAHQPPAGQQPPAQQPSIPADALAPSEQARRAFEVMQAHALTDEAIEASIQATGTSPRPMDDIIDQLFARGELVDSWQTSGIDLLATIGAREGGLARYLTVAPNRFGLSLTYYQDRPIDSFTRPEWVLIARRGADFEGTNVRIEIDHLSPKVILAERVGYRHVGNAYCRVQAMSQLYADPAVPASEFDMIAVIMTMRTLAAMERTTLCAVGEDIGQGQYRQRWFDAEGHRITIDRQSPSFRIVPVTPPQGSSR